MCCELDTLCTVPLHTLLLRVKCDNLTDGKRHGASQAMVSAALQARGLPRPERRLRAPTCMQQLPELLSSVLMARRRTPNEDHSLRQWASPTA
eukprot:CAMPEP_0183400980 /NCGR_PEP_ID=MMETSP0370-20130417/12964_1 /TAXON_ID=268820 /ORGANISM="Peridinium aciculiferum, Strain PAER-2" /LENGTH=92 /DNA_ID=CAMNT_0025582377 /DNA_START=305 /DNA_END=580 /DNA_ORIENTATION=+